MTPTERFEILKRDDFRCTYCGRGAAEGVMLHVDHIHPKSKGGGDEPSNLTTACAECNGGKGARLLSETGKPPRQPRAPRKKDAPPQRGLEGMYFWAPKPGTKDLWLQGRIEERLVDGRYLVVLCSWGMGTPLHYSIFSEEAMMTGRWRMHRDQECWLEDYEYLKDGFTETRSWDCWPDAR